MCPDEIFTAVRSLRKIDTMRATFRIDEAGICQGSLTLSVLTITPSFK